MDKTVLLLTNYELGEQLASMSKKARCEFENSFNFNELEINFENLLCFYSTVSDILNILTIVKGVNIHYKICNDLASYLIEEIKVPFDRDKIKENIFGIKEVFEELDKRLNPPYNLIVSSVNKKEDN